MYFIRRPSICGWLDACSLCSQLWENSQLLKSLILTTKGNVTLSTPIDDHLQLVICGFLFVRSLTKRFYENHILNNFCRGCQSSKKVSQCGIMNRYSHRSREVNVLEVVISFRTHGQIRKYFYKGRKIEQSKLIRTAELSFQFSSWSSVFYIGQFCSHKILKFYTVSK